MYVMISHPTSPAHHGHNHTINALNNYHTFYSPGISLEIPVCCDEQASNAKRSHFFEEMIIPQ